MTIRARIIRLIKNIGQNMRELLFGLRPAKINCIRGCLKVRDFNPSSAVLIIINVGYSINQAQLVIARREKVNESI